MSAEASLFMTLDELRSLTGYKGHTHQAKWLRANGIKFYISADGSPQVPRAQFENVTPSTRHAETERPPPRLNLKGLTPPSARE